MDAPLFEPLFTKRVNLLGRFEGFLLYDKLGFDYFSTSELLYPKMRVRLRIIRARPHFYIISDNPNVIFENIDCSSYNRCIALKDEYHEERMDLLAYTPMECNFLDTLTKTFIMTARQSQFLRKKTNNAPARRNAIAMNTNSAFIGSYTGIPSWCLLFNLRPLRIFIWVQPILDLFSLQEGCWKLSTLRVIWITPETGANLCNPSRKRYWTQCFGTTNVFGCNREVWCCWEENQLWTTLLSSK